MASKINEEETQREWNFRSESTCSESLLPMVLATKFARDNSRIVSGGTVSVLQAKPLMMSEKLIKTVIFAVAILQLNNACA